MDKKKILVVDDEKDVLKVLTTRLTEEGYSVVTSDKGSQALEIAEKEKPDLIILDIMMPDISGEKVGEQLRANPTTKDIPIIFLTSLFTEDDQRREGHTIGRNVFMAKPYSHEDLCAKIQDMLGSKK